jgi:hypothetical protein
VQRLRNRISHHERILTSHNRLYTGDTFLTLDQVLECVDWVCTDTCGWLKSRFRYAEAQHILAAVTSTGAHLYTSLPKLQPPCVHCQPRPVSSFR